MKEFYYKKGDLFAEGVKIKDVANLIAKKLDKKIKLVKKDKFVGGTNVRCPNINKLKKLGFNDQISLNLGLEKILKK